MEKRSPFLGMWDGGGEVTDRCGGVRGRGRGNEMMFVLSLTNATPPPQRCDGAPQLWAAASVLCAVQGEIALGLGHN